MQEKNLKIIVNLFIMFGVKDNERLDAYVMTFSDIPSDILELAVKKLIRERCGGFLPAPGDIFTAIDDVAMEALNKDPEFKSPTWEEARNSIKSNFHRTDQEWASPEVKQIISDYGGWASVRADGEMEVLFNRDVVPKLEKLFKEAVKKYARPKIDKMLSGQLTLTMLEQRGKERQEKREKEIEAFKARMLARRN